MSNQHTPKDPPPAIPLEKAPHLRITYAQPKHLLSLETIFQRAFHPTNAFHRRANPDTPLMRKWWRNVNEWGINHPATRVIIVEDTRPDVDEALTVLGICRARLMEPEERGAGLWGTIEPCADQSEREYKEIVEMMGRWREESCMGRQHYLIELLGCDPTTKGTGAGAALVKHVCTLADERSCDVFVQANGFASPFYEKQGFTEEYAEYIDSENGPYKEVKMLRHAKAAS